MKIQLFVALACLTVQSFGEGILANVCPPTKGIAVQILGSGGPIADDARASSGYLVWVDGRSLILIDAGGGVFLRFGESGAKMSELRFVGLSHFHTDHSSDLPALLKSGYFSQEQHALTITGPESGGPFPGLNTFLQGMLNSDRGSYGYLSGYLDGSSAFAKASIKEVDAHVENAYSVFEDLSRELEIDVLSVPHGIVPSLAYRIQIGSLRIVFAGDQNGSNPNFIDFAKDADVLVMHMPIPEEMEGAARKLHAPPSALGKIASEAKVNTLIISHLMQRSLKRLGKNMNTIKNEFSGSVMLAEDLACLVVGPQGE